MKLPANPALPGETENLLRLLRDIIRAINDLSSDGTLTLNYSTVSGDYTTTVADCTLEYTTGTYTVTLITAVGNEGKVFNIKNSGTGVITVDGSGTETIDGNLTVTLNQYDNLTIQSNGTNWIVL